MNSRDVWILACDAIDHDNLMAVVATCHPLIRPSLNLKMVIVTGRYTTIGNMERILMWGAQRVRGTLDHFGHNIPVYTGKIPPVTIVPERHHIGDEVLDVRGFHKSKQVQGNFQQAKAKIRLLAKEGKRINFIGAGPYGEIAELLQDKELAGCFGMVVGQYGPYTDSGVTHGGGRLGFNGACDPKGAEVTLKSDEVEGVFATTEITKDLSVTLKSATELAAMGVDNLLVEIANRFHEVLVGIRPNDPLALHDLHAVFAAAQLAGNTHCRSLYTFQEVVVKKVESRGELYVANGPAKAGKAKRSVITSVNARQFMKLVGKTLQR